MDYDDILAAALTLEREDRLSLIKTLGETLPNESLRKAVGLLKGLQAPREPEKSSGRNEETLYAAVAVHLRRRLGGAPPPLHVFKRTNSGPTLTTACREIDEYLDRLYSHLRLQDRIAFYKLYARLLSNYLTEVGAPVVLKSMFTNADKFPALVDRSFPGYATPATAHFLLMSVRSPTPPPEEPIEGTPPDRG